ncbi:MAG: CRISPR-associated helicase Cas3' [Peptoniphilaceae bacterium]
MNFENRISFENIINSEYKFYAHKRKIQDFEEKEKLEDHLYLTFYYFKKLVEDKNLEEVLDNIYSSIFGSDNYKEIFEKMIFDSMIYHDIGKTNPHFQEKKMGVKGFIKNTNTSLDLQDSHHSKYGAVLYFNNYYSKILEIEEDINNKDISRKEKNELKKDLKNLYIILLLNSAVILSHHGKLKSLSDNKEKFLRILNLLDIDYYNSIFLNNNKNDRDLFSYNISSNIKDKELAINLYIYQRFIFSLLVHSDVLATVDFIQNRRIENFGLINNIEDYRKEFEDNKITKSIRNYQKTNENRNIYKEINDLRSEIFLEAEKNIGKENIYQLEAPTGAGKTQTSINLAISLLEKDKNLNKIFYAFPFNTLVEQTYDTLMDIFKNTNLKNDIQIFNSTRQFELGENEETIDYEKLYMDYQFMYAPFIITTNVKLFEVLFGTEKSSYYPLSLLANSVIILDEIQSYKNDIWQEIIDMLYKYSKLLNIKIIIMSATLPDFNILLEEEKSDKIFKLIDNSNKFFNNPLFKNRVKLDFTLLENIENFKSLSKEDKKEYIYSSIVEKINELIKDSAKKILVEFIKKQSARDFYLRLSEIYENREDVLIKIITGETNVEDRKNIIGPNFSENDKLNKNSLKAWDGEKTIILVSTQTVEAGVDIDMHYGFKDISKLDSEEQFLGRINRSFKYENSIAFFFDLDNEKDIYSKDIRVEKDFTIREERMKDILKNKDFTNYYMNILGELKRKNEESSTGKGVKKFVDFMSGLDSEKIKNHMRLIDEEDKLSIFLNKEKDNKKSEVDNIWKEYKELIEDKVISIAEKNIRLMNHRKKMDKYIYQIYGNSLENYQDYAYGIYYFENGDEYFINDVFIPEKLLNKNDFDFL